MEPQENDSDCECFRAWGFTDMSVTDIHATGFSLSQDAHERVMRDRHRVAEMRQRRNINNQYKRPQHTPEGLNNIPKETSSGNTNIAPEPTPYLPPQHVSKIQHATPIATKDNFRPPNAPFRNFNISKMLSEGRARVPSLPSIPRIHFPFGQDSISPTRLSFGQGPSKLNEANLRIVGSWLFLVAFVIGLLNIYGNKPPNVVISHDRYLDKIEMELQELKSNISELSDGIETIHEVSLNVSELQKEMKDWKNEEKIEFEQIKEKLLDAENIKRLEEMTEIVGNVSKQIKQYLKPRNRAFRLRHHSLLMEEQNPSSVITTLKRYMYVPKRNEPYTSSSVDIFMQNYEYKSEDLPISDGLFLVNDLPDVTPFLEIELTQRLAPTHFEYIHISNNHLSTQELLDMKPIRFMIEGKKFSDQQYVYLGVKDMPISESTLSMNLIELNPEQLTFDIIKVSVLAKKESKYVCLYRIKILCETNEHSSNVSGSSSNISDSNSSSDSHI